MRRSEREVISPQKIDEILQTCEVLRIALKCERAPYLVPLCFVAIQEEGKYAIYFHSAKEGKKIELIKKNPFVVFETDKVYGVKKAQTGCAFSIRYQSVIGKGEAQIISDFNRKKTVLKAMVQKYGKIDAPITDEAIENVCVIKIAVHTLTGKENLS